MGCGRSSRQLTACATDQVSLEELFQKNGKVSSQHLVTVLRRLGMNSSESEARGSDIV